MKLTLIAAMLAATALLAGCNDAGPAKPETTALSDSAGNAAALTLTVYKTPSCGCCKKWVSHLEQQGVVAQTRDYDDLSDIKARYGIAPRYYSCHTAVSEQGYAFEGHIPAPIRRCDRNNTVA